MDNFKKYFSRPKIIFAIFGVVVVIEVIYAIRTLTLPAPPPPAPKTSIQSTVAKISLSTYNTVPKINETVAIPVFVDTGTHTVSGMDLIVKYDPKFLEATPAGLIKGKIFDEYPLKAIDVKNGIISISGVAVAAGFKGSGQFAEINFRAKTAGKTSVIVDFTKDLTTDSNLVDSTNSKDVLGQVDNLELNIQ